MALRPRLRPGELPERLLPLADRLDVQVPVEADGGAGMSPIGEEVGTGWRGPDLDPVFRLPEGRGNLPVVPGRGRLSRRLHLLPLRDRPAGHQRREPGPKLLPVPLPELLAQPILMTVLLLSHVARLLTRKSFAAKARKKRKREDSLTRKRERSEGRAIRTSRSENQDRESLLSWFP